MTHITAAIIGMGLMQIAIGSAKVCIIIRTGAADVCLESVAVKTDFLTGVFRRCSCIHGNEARLFI